MQKGGSLKPEITGEKKEERFLVGRSITLVGALDDFVMLSL